MGMGRWKINKIKKALMGRKNSTSSKKAKIVVRYPPADGWPGGLPEHNGWKPGKG